MSDDIGMDRLSKTRSEEQVHATVRSTPDKKKRSRIEEEAEEKRRRRRRDQVELTGVEEENEAEQDGAEEEPEAQQDDDVSPDKGGIDVTV